MPAVRDQRLLKVQAVAETLDVEPPTVREWIASGELPAFRLSRRCLRVARDDLAAFLRSRRVDGTGEQDE